jgi:DNA gyrase inhibitor GyrI
MNRAKGLRLVYVLGISAGLGGLLMSASCVSTNPFMIREAPLPEGWPDLTPVGEVRIQEYPVYRAASVDAKGANDAMNPMFYQLFNHIKKEGIPMTAPVDMGFDPDQPKSGPTRMAFLYRSTEQGAIGPDGKVLVEDFKPATFASLGMRGSYRSETLDLEYKKLTQWLEQQDEWRAAGPPRYLGYNSPGVPASLRFGELQIPVEKVN